MHLRGEVCKLRVTLHRSLFLSFSLVTSRARACYVFPKLRCVVSARSASCFWHLRSPLRRINYGRGPHRQICTRICVSLCAAVLLINASHTLPARCVNLFGLLPPGREYLLYYWYIGSTSLAHEAVHSCVQNFTWCTTFQVHRPYT